TGLPGEREEPPLAPGTRPPWPTVLSQDAEQPAHAPASGAAFDRLLDLPFGYDPFADRGGNQLLEVWRVPVVDDRPRLGGDRNAPTTPDVSGVDLRHTVAPNAGTVAGVTLDDRHLEVARVGPDYPPQLGRRPVAQHRGRATRSNRRRHQRDATRQLGRVE